MRCLRAQGGGKQWTVHNWWPMSYSTLDRDWYMCRRRTAQSESKAPVEVGREWMHGTEGRLIGWDPVAQTARWSVQEEIAINGGVLSTAGNLVFPGAGNSENLPRTPQTAGKKSGRSKPVRPSSRFR